jgi:hypothetical protein
MMPVPVRLIPDGAEVLLTRDEPFAIQAIPAEAPAAPVRLPTSLSIAIRYLGFQNVGDRREYALQAGRGGEGTRYTVSIELGAFSRKEALLQDGPDICYQKLLRALSAPEAPVAEGLLVTTADLEQYRATHTRPGPRSFSKSLTPPPAKT